MPRFAISIDGGWIDIDKPKGIGFESVDDQDVLAYIEAIETRQAWLDSVPRREHPDDERPWAAEYL